MFLINPNIYHIKKTWSTFNGSFINLNQLKDFKGKTIQFLPGLYNLIILNIHDVKLMLITNNFFDIYIFWVKLFPFDDHYN